MKIRIFSNMLDSVYRIVVNTEDWSQGDIKLMAQYGEPLVNLGGTIDYESDGEAYSETFGDEYVRIFHGFPYSRGFDIRDYGTKDRAVAAGTAWKESVEAEIGAKVRELRTNTEPLPTEEISEI